MLGEVRLTKGALGWGIKIPVISLLWFLHPGTMRCVTRLYHMFLVVMFCLDVTQGDKAK